MLSGCWILIVVMYLLGLSCSGWVLVGMDSGGVDGVLVCWYAGVLMNYAAADRANDRHTQGYGDETGDGGYTSRR